MDVNFEENAHLIDNLTANTQSLQPLKEEFFFFLSSENM